MSGVVIFRNRTTIVQVNLGFDVSADELISEVRKGKTTEDELIVAWDISFLTDGHDGKCLFKIDDSVVADVPEDQVDGWMDVKRISGGEPLPVLAKPIKAIFRDVVTA